jgi:isochorismate hydrolase
LILNENFRKLIKEKYYTKTGIQKQAKAFKKNVLPLSKKTQINILPGKVALLVIDMQEFFLNNKSRAYIPSAEAILPPIKALQNYFFKNNWPVFHTMHFDTLQNSENMLRWWKGDLLEQNNPLFPIVQYLQDPRALVLKKSQYSAFFNTNLNEELRRRNISQIIITGVMTHLCCETTARSAFMHGYEVFFTIDCTATYNKTFHLATLMNLAHGFALPVLSEEIL